MTAFMPRINRLFLACVVVPTVAATVYFGFIASDVYISESHFVVRSPQKPAQTGLGAILQGAGFARSQDDTYTVHDFMRSRDALDALSKMENIEGAYSKSSISIFDRFNGWGLDGSFENLFKYYQDRISLDLDTSSSISTLRVSAYSSSDAVAINRALLTMGEKLINDLNARGREDLIRFAENEVNDARENTKAASAALALFRNKHGVFDPDRQSALQLQMIYKLQDELIIAKTQLDQVVMLTPKNPQIDALRSRVETIQREIDKSMSSVSGHNASLASKASQYESLVLVRAFADKQLATALTLRDQAINEAARKQLYLERIVQPNTPDYPLEPRRVRSIFTALILSLVFWGVVTYLVAGIREHRN